jgi:hypothetical protein
MDLGCRVVEHGFDGLDTDRTDFNGTRMRRIKRIGRIFFASQIGFLDA